MIKKNVKMNGVSACIWGKSSKRVIVAVHGQQTHKEDITIAVLARVASEKGCQVLSFDLPNQGAVANRHDIELNKQILQLVLATAQKNWQKISLFASSIGAYFALQAFQQTSKIDYVYFLSPILNLLEIVDAQLQNDNLSPEQLQQNQSDNHDLNWDDYTYIKEHQTISWQYPTYILRGSEDRYQSNATIQQFVSQCHCKLKIVKEMGHDCRSKDALTTYGDWLERYL